LRTISKRNHGAQALYSHRVLWSIKPLKNLNLAPASLGLKLAGLLKEDGDTSAQHDTARDSVIIADPRVEEKTRRCSGGFVQLYGCTVAWDLGIKATAVESTCAAEFNAACMSESSAVSFENLIFGTTGNVVAAFLLVDNQSAVGKLPRPSGGTMWLQLKRRVVHQRHSGKLLFITYAPTVDQKADIVTESLTPDIYEMDVFMLSMFC
jgi:hypothetical protein